MPAQRRSLRFPWVFVAVILLVAGVGAGWNWCLRWHELRRIPSPDGRSELRIWWKRTSPLALAFGEGHEVRVEVLRKSDDRVVRFETYPVDTRQDIDDRFGNVRADADSFWILPLPSTGRDLLRFALAE